MDKNVLIDAYRKIIIDKSASWVLFRHGTCVMFLEPQQNIKEQAVKILREHGSVVAGTPSGDFEVTKIPEVNGWVVTGDYPAVMMYASLIEGKKKSDVEIGMLGRRKRELDAKELKVVHTEDKQNSN